MSTSYGHKRLSTAFLLWIAFTAVASAQTFSTLADFDGTNGDWPYLTSLVQGADGNLYGVTYNGGNSTLCDEQSGCGTIFRINPSGTLTTIYNFCTQTGCPDGYLPMDLTLGTNGNLYGTTYAGGASEQGTIFRITPQGKLTTLHSFCLQNNCADGAYPLAGLFEASDGNWYGTTFGGGTAGCYGYGCGTIFRMTPAGQLTTLYSFASGGNPAGKLIQGRDESLYGTTLGVPGDGAGTVFKITVSGALTLLHSFETSDGSHPYAGLVQGKDGNFYGTTNAGGTINSCVGGCGTVFKITPTGTVTTIYNFCSGANCDDGDNPLSTLVQATDGEFYGMTPSGGTGTGTVFSISSTGMLTTLHTFDGTDGAVSFCGFLQDTNGILYGLTSHGGSSNDGTIFSLNMGLSPFVSFVRGFGRVGSTVQILGQGFTGATAVSFNGTATVYSIKADTFITATVPTGATSGSVTVTTPGGTLTSNRHFHVNP